MKQKKPAVSAQGAFALARLGLVDDILTTAGWQLHFDGWLPPESYREEIERTHGRGHWSRANAIRFMVTIDEAVVAKGAGGNG